MTFDPFAWNERRPCLDKRRCMACGSSHFKNKYKDLMDGHTLLEQEDVCAKCGESVYTYQYGYSEDYTFSIRDLLKNLAL